MSKKLNQLMIISFFIITFTSVCFANGVRPSAGIIIFVSFSMPKESIKGWMKEAGKIHAPVVIRGLVNNSFKETMQRLNALVNDKKGGLQLDPILFKKFQIRQVPATVVHNKDEYDVVYGDVHLDYALKAIAKNGDAVSDVAEQALVRLREKKYA